MKKLSFLSLLTACAGFFSCQKEIIGSISGSDSTGSGGSASGGSSTGLLRKILIKANTGNDSTATYYYYNSSNKISARQIIGYNFASSIGSSTAYSNIWNEYERNTTGLITRSKAVDIGNAGDTVVTNYYYTNAATPKLKYSISSQSLIVYTTTDSTMYSYSSAGVLNQTETYETTSLVPTPTLSSRSVFTYDAAGNCTKIVTSAFLAGVSVGNTTIIIEYDSKLLPADITEEESLILSDIPAPKHNATKTTVSLTAAGTAQQSVVTDTYNYSSSNKPVSGTRVQTALGTTVTSKITVTYQ